jgi:hypothetical protein
MALVVDVRTRYGAFVVGSVIDEITGLPLPSFSVACDARSLDPKVVSGGFFCLAGDLDAGLPAGATIACSVSARGYHDARTTLVVPSHPAFPLQAATLRLRPLPVSVRGRVTDATTEAAVPYHDVTVLGSAPPNVLVFRNRALHDHTGPARLRARTPQPLGTLKRLTAAARAGTRTLDLDDRTGLDTAEALGVGPARVHQTLRIEPLAPNLGAGAVTLHAPLARSLAADDPAQGVTLTPSSATGVALVRDLYAGECVAVLAGAPPAGALVEVVDGQRTEYLEPSTITDARGRYAFDGIAAVERLDLPAPTGATPVAWTVDYASPVNVVDLVV